MTALCFDIGGSKYVTGLITERGEVLCKERKVWQELTADGILEALQAAGHEMLRLHPQIHPDVIGITIPGLADPKTGMWIEASFSGIGNLPIAKRMHDAFGMPVYIENDAKACALAEKLFGCAMDTEHFLYLTVSNGVGGAVFSDGNLLYGSGAAGECGHITVVENGRLCPCGKRGCLEMYAAGPGMARTYEAISGQPLDAKQIAQRARAGEPAAQKVFDLEGEYLGLAMGMAVNVLSPQLIVIGGGVSLAFDLYQHQLQQTLQSHIYQAANPALRVIPSALGYDGGLLGAAAITICGEQHLYGYQGKAVSK